ncbi:unnamed protein product [Ambrosiozyma monospora]|uniref:Unnamed protein product n=1 Tax=Ambrosiozyma monospora TaxID=43982 RepID=A0A9W7DKW0_AMBMO|nr:unnamed protein product [Ambrosiozyma monospora]
MYDYLMRLLDSRASRMSPTSALKSLHADYIGGANSNYRKWYFGSRMDESDISQEHGIGNVSSLKDSQSNWDASMASFAPEDYVLQLAIFLLVWGEANNARFMPEYLCFLFKCCVDVFYSLDFKELNALVPSFLDHAITPLYNFYREQLYEKIDNKWIQRDKDHARVIGYDDINQFFWYKGSLDKLQLFDKRKFMELPPHERFTHLDQINWKHSVRKTYLERRSWFHVWINFNRIWNIHIAMYWYYVSFNAGPLYTKDYDINYDNKPTTVAKLSAMSLAGTLVSIINLISLVCEFFFVPRRCPGTQSVWPRFFVMSNLLALNIAPTIYILFFVGMEDQSVITLAIAITQFIVSVISVIICSVVPLSVLSGNKRKFSNRRFLSAKYFTDSVVPLRGKSKLASYGMWAASQSDFGTFVAHRFCFVLLGYLLVVYYLEYWLLGFQILLGWCVYLDTMEKSVCQTPKKNHAKNLVAPKSFIQYNF